MPDERALPTAEQVLEWCGLVAYVWRNVDGPGDAVAVDKALILAINAERTANLAKIKALRQALADVLALADLDCREWPEAECKAVYRRARALLGEEADGGTH